MISDKVKLQPEVVEAVVIRFVGDSGDGMQLTGTQFSDTSAMFGNDIATFPNYPSEIRAPQGSLYGVSGFQVHIGSVEVSTPGDNLDLLVAMNPAGLKTNLYAVKPGHTIIVDTNSFSKKNLEKALKKLNLKYDQQKISIDSENSSFSNPSNSKLIISQSNGSNLEFSWNGQEYELIVDRDFWQQSCSINTFVDQIAQKYAGEVIIGESQKIGFQPVNYKQNIDNSNTLILQRYKLY